MPPARHIPAAALSLSARAHRPHHPRAKGTERDVVSLYIYIYIFFFSLSLPLYTHERTNARTHAPPRLTDTTTNQPHPATCPARLTLLLGTILRANRPRTHRPPIVVVIVVVVVVVVVIVKERRRERERERERRPARAP